MDPLNKESATVSRASVLKKIHEEGYVSKGALADIYGVHRETISRVVDWLIEENLVRLVGSPTGCPYAAFNGQGGGRTLFYTATRVDIGKKHPELAEVLKFFVHPECIDIEGKIMPRRFFLARRKELKSAAKCAKIREEWVPVHYAGSHLAAGFIAAVTRKIEGVETVILTSERVLRSAKNPISPMANGLFCVTFGDRPSFNCRIEFECFDMGLARYREYFNRLEECEFATLYIAVADCFTSTLDKAARNRRKIAVVTYGDELGCQKAIEGLMTGLCWQPPQRVLSGPNAGFVQVNPPSASTPLPVPTAPAPPILAVSGANPAVQMPVAPAPVQVPGAPVTPNSATKNVTNEGGPSVKPVPTLPLTPEAAGQK